MRKNKCALISTILVSILVFTFLLSTFSSASVIKGQPFFSLSQQSFGPRQTIEGTLNFSLTNEPGNTKVRATVNPGNIITEMDLLEFLQEANANFDCVPSDCQVIYSASNPQATKTVNLNENEEVYYGLVASGNNVQIQNLTFKMFGTGNTESVCYETPFKFDLLADGTIDFEYKETSDDWCGVPSYSECYNPSSTNDAFFDMGIPFCQKIWINKTGRVKVEAYMKYWGPGYGGAGNLMGNDIKFSIYELNGVEKGSCNVYWVEGEQYEFISCDIPALGENPDFYIEEPNYYYVCVKAVTNAAPAFSIKAESQGEICGFLGNPPQVPISDFAIRTQEAKFAPFISEAFFDETTVIGNVPLLTYVQNYINSKYNGNCSGDGCIIPLKFISLANQQITLDEIFFRFRTIYSQNNNNFYDLSVLPPNLNMTQQLVQFGALNASAPQQQGTGYITTIVGTAYDSATFNIESVPTVYSVAPLIVIPGQSEMFRVLSSVPVGRKIVNYKWDFGDGTSEQTTTNPNITHTYNQVGTYTLIVKAVDNLSMQGSGSFTITSNITREFLNDTINFLISGFDNFILQYNVIDFWYRDLIYTQQDLSTINTTLLTLKQQIPTATQTQLVPIKEQIDALDVPLAMRDSLKLSDSVYFVNFEEVDPEHVSEITTEVYDSNLKTQYQNAMVLWQEDNVNLRMSGFVKTLTYEDREEDKVSVITITLEPVIGITKAYLFFKLPYNVPYSSIKTFNNADEEHDLSSDVVGFVFYDLSSPETISIALPGKYDFSQIVFYASPSLQELRVSQESAEETKKPPYLVAVFLIILILAIVFAVLWIIWHGREKKKEKGLFKDPTEVYNIMSFISSSQTAGMSKKEIVEKLKETGWTKKQVDYAFKKSKEQKPAGGSFRRPSRLRRRF